MLECQFNNLEITMKSCFFRGFILSAPLLSIPLGASNILQLNLALFLRIFKEKGHDQKLFK
jgi:hypothetical protein